MSIEISQTPQPLTRDKKVFLSWYDINDYVTDITKYVLGSGEHITAIVTLHKGGIIPAVMLSYRLDIDDVYNFRINDTDIVYSKDIMNMQGKSILIVDNIVEKGERLFQLSRFLQNIPLRNITIVSLVEKPTEGALIIPHFAPRRIDKEDWAIFPWEELNY